MSEAEDDYGKRMDQIALRVGRILDGEELFDVASVCGLMAAFSLAEKFRGDPKGGREALAQITNFMTERFEVSISEHE